MRIETSTMAYPFGRCGRCGREYNSEELYEDSLSACPVCGFMMDNIFSREGLKNETPCRSCGLWIPAGTEYCAHCGVVEGFKSLISNLEGFLSQRRDICR